MFVTVNVTNVRFFFCQYIFFYEKICVTFIPNRDLHYYSIAQLFCHSA